MRCSHGAVLVANYEACRARHGEPDQAYHWRSPGVAVGGVPDDGSTGELRVCPAGAQADDGACGGSLRVTSILGTS